MRPFDAIVVGARCAGASTGLLLARQGLRVLLVDKATFPSDTLSTHMIHEPGVARLARWNPAIVDRIRASGCPPIGESTTDLGEFSYRARHFPVDGNSEAFCPRRTVLDPILIDEAVRAGCELRTGFVFEDVIWDGDRVVGVRGGKRGGAIVEEFARMVVGADGRRSSVAHAVKSLSYDTKPVTTCAYYTYWADTRLRETVISPTEGGAIVAVPTNDGLAVITAIFPIDEFSTVKSDVEKHYLAALKRSAVVMGHLEGARRAERFYGTADLPFFYRESFGPGWALVGDARHCKDPILARGISDAICDAETLCAAIGTGFSATETMNHALTSWSRSRDEATRDIYELTYRLSLLKKTSPVMARVYEAARTNATVASRFHGVISGSVRYRDFFVSDDIDELLRVNS